jgi:hypothetical protein
MQYDACIADYHEAIRLYDIAKSMGLISRQKEWELASQVAQRSGYPDIRAFYKGFLDCARTMADMYNEKSEEQKRVDREEAEALFPMRRTLPKKP